MQTAQRLFDQVNANRSKRLTGVCVIVLVGVLLCAGVVQGPGVLAAQRGSQQQELVLDQRKDFCPGPATDPTDRKESWWRKFAQQLAAEVATSDAQQVRFSHELNVHQS